MNELHPFYRPEILKVLRYAGLGLLLSLLLAEWLIELPGPFGLHAGYALLGVVVPAVVAIIVGRLFDRVDRGDADD